MTCGMPRLPGERRFNSSIRSGLGDSRGINVAPTIPTTTSCPLRFANLSFKNILWAHTLNRISYAFHFVKKQVDQDMPPF